MEIPIDLNVYFPKSCLSENNPSSICRKRETIFVQNDAVVPGGHILLVQERSVRQAAPIRVLSWKLELEL